MFLLCGIIQPSQEGAGNGLAVTVPVPLFRLYGVNKMDREQDWNFILAHPEIFDDLKGIALELLDNQCSLETAC